MTNLEITKDKVLKAAKTNPCAKEVLETLFPEAFEDEKPFVKIGTTFKRRTYKSNEYCLIKHQGEVCILNITHGSFWDSKRNLKVRDLKAYNQNYLTIGEFKQLVDDSLVPQDDFIFPEHATIFDV